MRRLWSFDDIGKYVGPDRRSGLRMHFESGIDPEVIRAAKQYAGWLRENYTFPVRVNVYFKNKDRIINSAGERVCGTFFGPFSFEEEPYIRLAAGDYPDLCAKYGKDDSLASYLLTLTHELSHYFQWIRFHENWNDDEWYEKHVAGSERQACYYARKIVRDYADIYEHP